MSCCVALNIYYSNGDRINVLPDSQSIYNGKDAFEYTIEVGDGTTTNLYLWFGIKGWQLTTSYIGIIPVTTFIPQITDDQPDCPTWLNNVKWGRGPTEYIDAIVTSLCADFNTVCCFTMQFRHLDGTYTQVQPELVEPNRQWNGRPVWTFDIVREAGEPAETYYVWATTTQFICSTLTEGKARTSNTPTDTYFYGTSLIQPMITNCPTYGNGIRWTKLVYKRS